ncbi:MAG: chorismate mutase [Gemmatimonadetes bacterium]|nr:chorismate mutase [Gemmatimonadota bacterium]
MELSDWRERIDGIDRQLIDLLNERMQCAHEVGRIKKAAGKPIRDPERERDVITKIKTYNQGLQGPVKDESLEKLYWLLIELTTNFELEED